MFIVIGIIMIAIASVLRYWIGRRQYYRRHTPVREIRSYSSKLATRFFEDIISFIYYFLFIVGVLLLAGGVIMAVK